MPFCTQCAHAIPQGSRFCPACGAPVVPAAAPAAVPAPAASPPRSRPETTSEPTRTSDPNARPAPPSPPSGVHGRFEPGTRIGTRYRIVALLGRGGMGEVYRADDLDLAQSVALKFLPRSLSEDAAALTRFRGEVRIARQIAHPNVCRVYDIGEADGHVFLSMEYIDGEDLASVLRRMGRPTPDKATELARQICLGLAAAHEAGMLHRDLKPANVMIDGRGRARITDFGLAGLADELSRGGEFAGTPAYMAPEQLAHGRVSVKSDLFGLGCVLYELFTGRRVFPAENMAELKQLQDSSSITTPSTFARDIDPAIERLILHCLERDPDLRPASAYAVLGALPGGDPLAAALAAGETPSPELVANAGDHGGLSPAVAVAAVLAGLAGIAVWAGLIGPEFASMNQPSAVLSVRAADIAGRTGAFGELPAHTSEGFAQHLGYLKHLREDKTEREAKHRSVFFWRRWSPRLLEDPEIHREIAGLNSPPLLATGEAAILLDPEGRLLGWRALPPDTARAANGGHPAWRVLFEAAGLDTAAFAPTALVRPVPASCDTAAAWAGAVPWLGNERVTVQMGASRGRLTHFTIVHDWGATNAPVDSLPAENRGGANEAIGLILFGLVPLGGSVVFAFRNLRLHRGDTRGATRIAIFVFVMNILEAVFTTRLSEVGLIGAGFDLISGRAFGHSLIHAVGMWFAYVALEPYLRSLWPRMLVGWTRLLSGRARDPLVGRDTLIGTAAGLVLVGLSVLTQFAAGHYGLTRIPTLVTQDMLGSLGGLSLTGCSLAYAGSVCVLSVLEFLVLLLLARLLLRRTWPAVALSALLIGISNAVAGAPDAGWPVAIVNALPAALVVLVVMRFGLLAGVVMTYVGLVTSTVVPTLQLSAWYGDRALVPLAILLALLGYGALTAMAGKPILGDPLGDSRARGGRTLP